MIGTTCGWRDKLERMGFLDRFKKQPEAEKTPEPSTVAEQSNAATEPATIDQPVNAPQPAELPVETQVTRPAERGPENASGQPPNTVRVFDEFGRELFIPVDTWRKQLAEMAAGAQDDPQQLYSLIVQMLELGYPQDALAASERLFAIDFMRNRGVSIRAIVLMQTGDAATAEKLLEDYVREYGLDGAVLTNLAKAQEAMGHLDQVEPTLWRALEIDPNLDNAVGWFAARAQERGGVEAYLQALERVAALPDAWMAPMWLGHEWMTRRERDKAMPLFAQAIANADTPVPAMLLQTMSGDLGNAGLLEDLLQLILPHYDAQVHGLQVGNNLIKASLDSGRVDQAKRLVEELLAQRRPDWQQNLQFWEAQLQKASLAEQQPRQNPKLTMMRIEGPVWLNAGSPAAALFPAQGTRRAKVLFLGSSVAHRQDMPEMFKGHIADAAGRWSRALPLFLAESAAMHLALDVEAMIPWVEGGGFAVLPTPWDKESALQLAEKSGAQIIVALHLIPEEKAAQVQVQLWNRIQTNEASAFTLNVGYGDAPGALMLWERVASLLAQIANASSGPVPSRYLIPGTAELGDYLLRLEQLLAVRCGAAEDSDSNSLFGAREIVQGELILALRLPDSLPLRLILNETLNGLRKLSPAVVAEFRDRVMTLQEKYRLADEEAVVVLEAQLQEIFKNSQ